MSGQEVLLALGEVAFTVAGFSSVVAVFGRRSERAWSAVESFRLTALIMNSAGPALLAYLPFVLGNLGVTEPFVWGISSAVLLSLIVAESVWVYRVGSVAFRVSGQPLQPLLVVIANSCSVVAALLQVFNLAGIGFDRELGPYLAGLVLLLVIAVVQFCVLILAPSAANTVNASDA